ncbi:hypothetical protein ZOSMA_26G00090 [Zostera marina]|uniref:Protein NUCLEAR FUSION DEFECTIVE 6, chloroplastic/mitochondrial-like n=1 Tax=Zostera marina TaxID=29655 RepID=A0A0K9PGA0_ZOSMR|nr:hypothetical protein ZOSMA_26G00090 [Zostera marina]
MASVGTLRSVLRSASVRNVASKIATDAKASSSSRSSSSSSTSFRIPGNTSAFASSRSAFRSPVQLSFCVESLLPLHSATASSLMTSMLSVSLFSYGSLFEAAIDDV